MILGLKYPLDQYLLLGDEEEVCRVIAREQWLLKDGSLSADMYMLRKPTKNRPYNEPTLSMNRSLEGAQVYCRMGFGLVWHLVKDIHSLGLEVRYHPEERNHPQIFGLQGYGTTPEIVHKQEAQANELLDRMNAVQELNWDLR